MVPKSRCEGCRFDYCVDEGMDHYCRGCVAGDSWKPDMRPTRDIVWDAIREVFRELDITSYAMCYVKTRNAIKIDYHLSDYRSRIFIVELDSIHSMSDIGGVANKLYERINGLLNKKEDKNMPTKHDNRLDVPAWLSKEFHIPYKGGYVYPNTNTLPKIEKVIFNKPATIVMWSDGTKTVVKTQNKERFNKEKGLAMAIAKKALGNQGNYYEEFKKWL